jgi:hypothetical protein
MLQRPEQHFGLTSGQVGQGLRLDENGVLHWDPDPTSALVFSPGGQARINTDGTTMEQSPGSPVALKANPRDSEFTTVTQEVVDESVSTITIDLQALRTLLTAPFAGMVFGRGSASAGSGEWLTIGNGITMTGTMLSFVVENRTSDPAAPAVGQLWLRTDL